MLATALRARACSSASAMHSSLAMDPSRFRTCHRRHAIAGAVLIISLAIAGGPSITGAPLRFRAEDPVSLVSETRNASDVQPRSITHFRDSWNGIWKIGDRTREKALDVSTIDEVPDSSWFENRIATRPMTTSEIAAGPNRTPPSGPWTVTSGKTEGITPGLQMKDSTGQLYFVKFDPPAYPELGTGAEVISTKLLYAAGYHVPQNFIVIVGREEMQIAPNAPLRGSDGKAHPMTGRDLDALLTQ